MSYQTKRKSLDRLREGAVSMIFEGSQAQLTGAEYQEQPRDANAERQKDFSTTAHTVGAFPYSGKCHNENSQPCLQEDTHNLQPGGYRDLLREKNSLNMPFNEYFAEESGTSSSTARNDNITNSLSAIQNSLLPERFLHPEKVKLLPSWGPTTR